MKSSKISRIDTIIHYMNLHYYQPNQYVFASADEKNSISYTQSLVANVETNTFSLSRMWKNASLSCASFPEDWYNGGNVRLDCSELKDADSIIAEAQRPLTP